MSKTVDEKLDDFLEIEGDISVAAKNIVPAVKGDLEFYDQELERNKDIEEDYYQAMAVIQRGEESDEPYRISTALQKVFEEKKLHRSKRK